MQETVWLPSPGAGARVCLGFDGSDSDDWTAIQGETVDGFSFTPRYGPDRRPAVWNPAEWGGSIPRGEVHAAVDELFSTYEVARFYADPHDWFSEIGDWALKYGDNHVFEWPTNQVARMFPEIRRFEIDLAQRRLTQDGCPLAAVAAANAKKIAKPGQKYVLGKPAQHQKIDVIMARILAHTAAADAHEAGWDEVADNRIFSFR